MSFSVNLKILTIPIIQNYSIMKKITRILFLMTVNVFFFIQLSHAETNEWAKSFGGEDDDQPYATAIDGNGNLFVLTQFKAQCDFDPHAYKTANITPISMLSSVAVSKYDANGNFLWVKSFSANSKNGGTVYGGTMVLDKAGNVFFGGNFSGVTDFNPDPVAVANLTPEAITPAITITDPTSGNLINKPGTYDASQDAYVCKLDNDGKFVWVKQFRGDFSQDILEISADEASNVFISCDASGLLGIQTDFNPDPTATALLTNTSNESQYIVKLNAEGNYVWAKQLQGTGDRYCYGIKTDTDGNLYLGGHFIDKIYPDPSNTATYHTAPSSTTDLFFIKWDANGNYVWSKSFGGTSYDVFGSLEIEPATNSIYISGDFYGTVDFNMSPSNKKTLSTTGNNDGFLAKYDAAGNCEWAKQFGGAGQDKVQSISLDALGNVFIGGKFEKTANFDAGASNVSFTSAGNGDAFIAKLDNQGNFKWAKQIGGLGWDWPGGLSAIGDGNVFAAGVFTFEASIGFTGEPLTAVGGREAWMFKSSLTTDIKDTKLEANISIYPNPTQGETVINLNKEFSEMTVTVRNLLGAVVSSNNFHNVSKINLNLQGESGFYLLELKDGNGRSKTMKVVKE